MARGTADGVYIGLMSGTSMDGVDGVAVEFTEGKPPVVKAEAFVGFSEGLRDALFALQQPGENEIEREALAANALATRYMVCCHELMRCGNLSASQIRAVGVHGQTVRHRPEKGYTRQINNPSLLAEMTHVDVVADFRSRDVAAGGQGAPLVPAFHATVFGKKGETRVVCNLGGISNITILGAAGGVRGFDCGPANALLDEWAHRHLGKPFDEGGAFAASGQVHRPLLNALLNEPFFEQQPPKSTGRDLFNAEWMDAKLAPFADVAPADVQATLTALTAITIAREIERHASDSRAVYVCGGGARNPELLKALQTALEESGVSGVPVMTTEALGVPPNQVEPLAFAWLAMRCIAREPGNLPAVTGAASERVLGAIYPR
ncbi:anhydro-N-acetylmuramic acid kinase [Paraburkholderia saeva]|uniref:Anhydro-N-acetylmuramic acid kinase n=1 Tax=Paraburkholderia saeva TaxID=2777537 RepID=A0A9N8X020_9BURK|nr:anhydro-N-acetylmuramic acid kinase [Paraburkholderia saeva]CAG4886117.1 Anhydro-N-acetylmuramic acid kinase [Paraburkholderia saeva]CAG4887442.1 Anhydro-N-acetylmuramic acid kinase [Paraburkholderia saeva]CAG4902974.1 Anhydro-N-acetylmuramic acid kinase [Paraburkholderia saeva]